MPTTDFIALDVETANADFGSICSIGLAHFRAGEFYKALTILVDPEDEFDSRNIAIHGIRPEHVTGKPNIAKVLPVISKYLDDTIVVHHSQFDRGALSRAAASYNVSNLSCNWLDTLSVARRTWKNFSDDGGYGLANIARSFNIRFKHHDAAEDARAAGFIMLRALDDSGLDLEDWLDLLESKQTRKSPAPLSSRKKEVLATYSRAGNAAGRLAGEIVVFTGFLQMPRSEAAALAANAGFEVYDYVTKKTTILVVGQQDLRLTKGQEKSSKHRKCEELIANGANIRIVGESDFVMMTG